MRTTIATKRPWTVDLSKIEYGHTGFPIRGQDGYEIARVPIYYCSSSKTAEQTADNPKNKTVRANAALIVAAVNSYEALRDALQSALKHLPSTCNCNTRQETNNCLKCRVINALELAEGKE